MTGGPHTVYVYHDGVGRPLYVGITSQTIGRSVQHSVREWWPLAAGCSLEHFAYRSDALRREEELIRRYKPPFNKVYNRDHYRDVDEWLAGLSDSTGEKLIKRTLGEIMEARQRYYAAPRYKRATMKCPACGEKVNRGPGGGPVCMACHNFFTHHGFACGSCRTNRTHDHHCHACRHVEEAA